MSIVSGTISGVENANAQKDAAEKNAQSTAMTNLLNYNMFQQSRGAGGSAILPTYMRGMEKQLSNNAVDTYNAARSALTPEEQIAQSKAILAGYQPMIEGADKAAAGIFNGDMERQQLASQQGVINARNQGVTVRKNANMEALAQTLNEISAIQASKGYSGDSLGARMLGANARRQNATATALDQSNASLQNAQDVNAIKQGAIATKLNSLSLPAQLAQQNMALLTMPQDNAIASEQKRQGVFNMFNIGNRGWQAENAPAVQPIQSPLGAAAQMASGVGAAVGNAALQRWINSPSGNAAAGSSYTMGGGYTSTPITAPSMSLGSGGSALASSGELTSGMRYGG